MNHAFVFFFHLIFSAIMVGVIWVIQLVHYPSFHFIDKDIYDSFQKFHMNKISIIVVPVMILELATGVLLLIGNSKNILIIISFCMLILIWGITGLFFSDVHGKLISGYNELIVNKLVSMNWIRTVLWTFKMILLLYLSYAYNKI